MLVLQGQYAAAEAELAHITTPGSPQEEMRRSLESMEVAWKRGRPLDAIRAYDQGRRNNAPINASLGFSFGNALAGYGPAFGRLVEFDSLLVAQMRAGRAPDFMLRYQRSTLRGALTGTFNDSAAVLERMVYDSISPRSIAAATRSIAPTLIWGLRIPRARWPAVDSTHPDPRLRPAMALARRDTTRLRAAAQALDSLAAVYASASVADSSYSLIAADAWLALGDTTAALRSLRYMLDASASTTPYFPPQSSGVSVAYFAPRAMLLRADLAAARGLNDEARTWYQRFIDTWSTAVPELQPTVERAKQSLARLNARP